MSKIFIRLLWQELLLICWGVLGVFLIFGGVFGPLILAIALEIWWPLLCYPTAVTYFFVASVWKDAKLAHERGETET